MSTLESFPGWDRAATGLPEQRRVVATTEVMVNGPDDVSGRGGSRGWRTLFEGRRRSST
jgi:hypothetical protein